jgi:hypothetical protein
MSSSSSTVDIGIVSNAKDETDYALMERMHKIEEEQKKKEKFELGFT